MIRRRGAAPSDAEESSSDEEDAFSALSKKTAKAGRKASVKTRESMQSPKHVKSSQDTPTKLPVANTSSMKRHHGTSDKRKAKMDALLQELEADKESAGKGHYAPSSARDGFVPDKKGSFVEPGEEHLTTNIFVGNLDPTITEEEVTELFRQFGDLYSVKIMWPRTAEERARNRNTGFVCFMTREDAQEAMDAFNENDPFRVGRRLMMRWGKNVKKCVKRGTGGVQIAPIRKKSLDESYHSPNDAAKRRKMDHDAMFPSKALAEEGSRYSVTQPKGAPGTKMQPQHPNAPLYDPNIHAHNAIRVVAPTNQHRLRFITTVASFVSKDGAVFERKLIESQSNNPDFSFLTLENAGERQRNEYFFYRWRVFAFCQGDGFDSWRTEPFMMFQPHGRFWIPPSLNREAAWREQQAEMEKEEQIWQRKQQRRRIAERKDFMTGRQLEQAKFGRAVAGASDGGAELTEDELEEFDILVKKKLCASREAICEAMAFCYDKSGAAKQIADLLKQTLLDDSLGISVDTRIARLFLLSDVLFNSQQPGVRNAFLYRTAIEKMAPDVFSSFGRHGKGRLGRMTLNKLRTAVGAVLGAWTNWSVYNPTFLDELHAKFEGREIVQPDEGNQDKDDGEKSVTSKSSVGDSGVDNTVILEKPRGDWTAVTEDQHREEEDGKGKPEGVETSDDDKADIQREQGATDGEPIDDDDVDGEPIDDDDVDGEPIDDDDVDGEPIDYDDVDGEPINANDVDGEQIGDDDDDGKQSSMEHQSFDGEPIDANSS